MPEEARGLPWAVMVLAHNEERHIEDCLDSILAAEPGRQFDIFVMANGCTDKTEELVAAYGRRHAGVHPVSIELGDKCNAWNVFIHETVPTCAPGRDVYFFMDGDARAVPGSFTAMSQALERNPAANAASAVPASGRYVTRDRQQLLAERGLVANLYALRGSFVERLRQLSVRMPLQLEGDDGLIGALVKWDLDPRNNEYDDGRIVPCADAAFEFEPMSLSEAGRLGRVLEACCQIRAAQVRVPDPGPGIEGQRAGGNAAGDHRALSACGIAALAAGRNLHVVELGCAAADAANPPLTIA